MDRALNCAVLHIASRIFPTGFDIAMDAPASFEDLVSHLSRTGRMVVWSGGPKSLVFEDREVQYAFRAWHNVCHWRGNLRFTTTGELGTLAMHRRHLIAIYDDTEQLRRWCAMIEPEIVDTDFGYHIPSIHRPSIAPELRVC